MAVAVPSNPGYFDTVRAHFPCGTKTLRACIQCRIIMERKQFIDLGCPQCKDLKMQDNETRVVACTTMNFEGFIANIRPGGFATRFTGLEKSMVGFYALSVRGEIPPETLFDERDDDGLRDFIEKDASSDSALENELFPGQPSGKRQKTRRSLVQGAPSSPSSTSEADGPDAMKKALDFIASGSEPGTPQADPPASSEAASDAAKDQVVASSVTSASDAQSKRGKKPKKPSKVPSSKDRESDRGSVRSSQTGTSRSSVAILEPEVDDEFRNAPQ